MSMKRFWCAWFILVIVFGRVEEGTVLNYAVEVKNASNEILRVGMRSSCDCLTVRPERIDLKSRQKAKVKIKIDTTGYSRNFAEKIFFQSNDPVNPYIAIELKGDIISSRVSNKENVIANEVKNTRLTIPITVFDTVGCLFCMELRQSIIPAYEKKYNIKIELYEYSVDDPDNYALLTALEEKREKTLNKIPVVFIGDDIIGGKKEIIQNLPALIEKHLNPGGSKKVEFSPVASPEQRALRKLKIIPVLLAGIVDSVNPCAFATIIFFLTYLSLVLKKQRYEIFLTGIIFIVGVYLTYFLIGLGTFKAVQKLNKLLIFSKIMYVVVGILALMLSFRHFYEAILIKRRGKLVTEDIKLKLPEVIRSQIHKLIIKFSNLKYLLLFVFVMAVLITVLELICTGQVYLPTIMYLVSLPEYRIRAVWYLVLYCFLFVLPLMVIFGLFYFGLGTGKLKRLFTGEVFIVKIITAIFFLILGLAILLNGVY